MNIPAALEEVCPRHGLKYARELDEAATRYAITTPLRAAHWLGQLAHESGEFKDTRENLNYSAEGLMRTWPTRFPTKAIADQYARDPLKIANFVYAGRMGNGPATSGDGARFIGRGFIQITGRENYQEASRTIYEDDRLIYHPELAEQAEAAALTAGWFWMRRGLNALADSDDIVAITKKINGGILGLEHRKYWVERFKAAL